MLDFWIKSEDEYDKRRKARIQSDHLAFYKEKKLFKFFLCAFFTHGIVLINAVQGMDFHSFHQRYPYHVSTEARSCPEDTQPILQVNPFYTFKVADYVNLAKSCTDAANLFEREKNFWMALVLLDRFIKTKDQRIDISGCVTYGVLNETDLSTTLHSDGRLERKILIREGIYYDGEDCLYKNEFKLAFYIAGCAEERGDFEHFKFICRRAKFYNDFIDTIYTGCKDYKLVYQKYSYMNPGLEYGTFKNQIFYCREFVYSQWSTNHYIPLSTEHLELG